MSVEEFAESVRAANKLVRRPPWVPDPDDGLIVYNGGKLDKVADADQLIATGQAKRAYIHVVYATDAPGMAQVVYPDDGPNIVRVDMPGDWVSSLNSFIPKYS